MSLERLHTLSIENLPYWHNTFFFNLLLFIYFKRSQIIARHSSVVMAVALSVRKMKNSFSSRISSFYWNGKRKTNKKMFRRHPNQCEHPANMSFKSCFSWGGGSYEKAELIKNKFCQSLTHDPVRIFEGHGWIFFFKLDFISRRFHIRFMIWLEILKSYSRMAEKLI